MEINYKRMNLGQPIFETDYALKQTDRQTDRQTDGRTDGQTDGQ